MPSESAQHESREFLLAFLAQLDANNETTRELVAVQRQLIAQLQVDAHHRSILSQQIVDLAKRIDKADASIEGLSSAIEGEAYELAELPPPPPRARRRSSYPTPGQAIGGIVDYFGGGSGGRRSR